MLATACLLHWVCIQEIPPHSEARHITRAVSFHVPVSRDLNRVVLIQHGIEDWLFGEARRKSRVAGFLDEAQFRRPNRPPQDHQIGFAHPNSVAVTVSIVPQPARSGCCFYTASTLGGPSGGPLAGRFEPGGCYLRNQPDGQRVSTSSVASSVGTVSVTR